MANKRSAGARLGSAANSKNASTQVSDLVTSAEVQNVNATTAPASCDSEAPARGTAAARRLLKQANEHASSKTNVVNLHGDTLALSKVVRYLDENNTQRLKACFPTGPDRDDDEHDLTLLLKLPNILEGIAKGFLLRGQNLSPASRAQCASGLRNGLIAYLASKAPNIAFSDIDRPMLRGFEAWMNAKPGITGKPAKSTTAEKYHVAARKIFETLKSVSPFSSDATRIFSDYPKRTNPGSQERTESYERLSRDDLEKTDRAVQNELIEIRNRWHRGQQLIETGGRLLEQGKDDNTELSIALAKIAKKYEGIPTGTDLKRDDSKLFRAIDKGNGHTLSAISSYLSAQAADLVPFVLFFVLETGWNAEGVLALKWSSIKLLSN